MVVDDICPAAEDATVYQIPDSDEELGDNNKTGKRGGVRRRKNQGVGVGNSVNRLPSPASAHFFFTLRLPFFSLDEVVYEYASQFSSDFKNEC